MAVCVPTSNGHDAIDKVARSSRVVLDIAQDPCFVDNKAEILALRCDHAVFEILVKIVLSDKAVLVERCHLESIEHARIFDVRGRDAIRQDSDPNKLPENDPK